MKHEIEVSACGNTVWINSGFDGSCIGRFSKKFGMDVHKTGTQQMAGEGECIFCTHKPGNKEDWLMFIRLIKRHYQLEIKPNLISF